MKIVNARLRRQEALFTLELQEGIIRGMTAQTAMRTPTPGISTPRVGWRSRPSSSRISILTPP